MSLCTEHVVLVLLQCFSVTEA